MAIHTPDQRVRVFVSSTMQELAPERGAARDAIESLRLTPIMFEQLLGQARTVDLDRAVDELLESDPTRQDAPG
jgi:Domain of unknown function (DUF4062)